MLLLVIVLGAVGTFCITVWLGLLFSVQQEDLVGEAYSQVLDNHEKIMKLTQKDKKRQKQIEENSGIVKNILQKLYANGSAKEITKLQQQNERIQSGYFKKLNLLIFPGYAAQRRFAFLGRGKINKTLYQKNAELYGKKHAENKTRHLIAAMVSYALIGVGASLCLGTALLACELVRPAIGVLLVGTTLILVLTYAQYDELSDRLNKRREAIERQFPNVVSKLALLVSSGMIMQKAWRETAHSHSDDLYMEMRITADELDQNMGPQVAYGNFINRCNTKETTKLASAILQSESKGNKEIGQLLRDLAKESWENRKHSAKRNSEKANSKLMIPTMLLFVAILIIIMVPVAVSFSGL